MVTYIKSDLDFILAQIKISEAHAAGQPLFGAPNALIPTYNLAWGLRTVDGSYNHLLPGQEQWGAADQEFLELLGPQYRTIMVDPDGAGPSGPIPIPYTPGNDVDGPGTFADPGDVIDPEVRTISNLIVDQTLGNPAAILTALQRAGVADPGMLITASISAAYAPLQDEFRAVADAQRVEAAAAAAADASPGNAALQAAATAAAAALAAAQLALDTAAGVPGGLYELLANNGIELDGANVHIPNVAPDEGLSAPFNSWFTLFGQFFDHGLDLVNKGGNGTVMIPLQPDDPLYSTAPGALNFMVLTRATTSPGADGILGDNPTTVGVDESADDGRPINTTTSYVDQNQTYTSHSSHQVFIRQYELNAAGRPVATGNLIEGGNGGMATWAELKVQARTMLGIDLTDDDVGKVPLLRTDQYGNFIPDPLTGFAQVITGIGADGIPNTADDIVISGTPAAPVSLATAVRTNHAFLADIAHNAVPTGLEDGDITIGLGNPENGPAEDGSYDNELLDAHFIAGDGRVNENIGLTAVHHVFHAEHNRLVEHTKAVVLATGDAAFIAEWQLPDGSWNGERLFQAAKFGTEMQYQHLVFEEFARKIQPNINVFLVPDGFDTTLNPSIVAEFAHVVYRFGHSMLTESIDKFDPSFQADHISLIQGFLNPTAFDGVGHAITDQVAAGAIIRGMTRQVGNQIDEFVTSALRNNLLGLPLDLATINLARGRDTGVPSLNAARAEFYEASNQNVLLKPYESWVDFAGHLKNEASIINFIASYGTHDLITGADTLQEKRDAALTIITGVSVGGMAVPADALDFLNATGAYAGGSLGGLNNVDLWIGGLAEETMPFGGMLGSTFNFVFEVQMENLQSGDRFYYLQRLDGLHLFGEMENNSFAAMIMRNTDATHLPSDVFSTPGLILETDITKQFNDLNGDGILESTDPLGTGILTQLVIRNDPSTAGVDTHYLRYTGGDHVVLGGTNLNNTLIGGIGDDTLFGDGGADKLEGGFGNDIINGGDGDDIITDAGGDDNIKAGAGNDVVHAGPGLDLVMGNDGQDFIFLGTDMGSEVFAGTGNDFIYGNKNAERILGNEGNDWIETGTFDGAPGDNFDEIFSHDTINGHDVFLGDGGFDEYIGEGGDDIMVGSAGRGKMAGMSGFDWATYKDSAIGPSGGINADLSIPIIFDEAPTIPTNAALDEYQSMEGLSGSAGNDILRGSNILAEERLPFDPITNPSPLEGYQGSALDAEGIAMIAGLQAVLGAGVTSFSAGDIILGGDGSDVMAGQQGDDIIDGDKWLDVQIGVFAPGDVNHTGTPIALHNSMTTLAAAMFAGTINPGQLSIVRTIRNSNDQPDRDGIADVDVAQFADVRANYTITPNADGSISVAHVTVTDGLESDGVDRVSNVEILRFSDQDVSLTKPVVDLHAFDVGGTYADTFPTNATNPGYGNSTGATAWGPDWTETADGANNATTGQITLTGGELRFATGDGATITRTVPLGGAAGARLTYSVEEQNLDGGGDNDNIQVQFSADGTTNWTTVDTINSQTGTTTRNIDLPGPFTATSAIRFVASTFEGGGGADIVDIVSVSIEFTVPAPADGLNYATNYAEGAAGVAISNRPNVTDDGANLVSARIVLTNAQPGDDFDWGAMPAGITAVMDSSVEGQLTVNLTGTASLAAYRTAIGLVTFDSTSQNPAGVRNIEVTVNDGLLNSDPAITTITVTGVNDAPDAVLDNVITNVSTGNFLVPEWVMLANDTDPEGSVLNVTTATENDAGFAITFGATGDVTAGRTDTDNTKDFTYTLSDGTATDTADVDIVWDTAGALDGTAAGEILIGDGAGTVINAGGGNDIILANAGNDTINTGTGNDRVDAGTGTDLINWNANAGGDTDGFDIVDGGANTDTFDVNTRANTAEIFRVYTNAAAVAAGMVGLGINTEIVITRTVAGNTSIIAELDNIEEIRIGTQTTDPVGGPAGGTPGDTVQIFGDFSTTSLALNTITIDGNAGDDTIDISALSSAHRIVFRSNGGNDTLVGTLRPQDVIELPDGAVPDDYDVATDENGLTTMTSPTHSICFTAGEGMPQFSYGDHDDDDDDDDDDHHDDDDDDDDDDHHGHDDDDDDDDDHHGHDDDDDDDCGCDDDDDGPNVPAPTGTLRVGTVGSDVLIGTAEDNDMVALAGDDVVMGEGGADTISGGEGADFIKAGAGADVVLAGAGDDQAFGGAGADMLYGEAGADTLFGEGGDDMIDAGSGNDTVIAGAGNDRMVGGQGDGDDTYFGDDSDGGNGIDTLDLSAITANLTVDLGNGLLGRGNASSSQSGADTLWHIENVATGSGSDTITASNAVNVMEGGSGNDTFRFLTTAGADGDTILGFEPGDRLDLSGIDANTAVAGNQAFTLANGPAFTASAQLLVTYETRADGEYTVVSGNVDANNANDEFRIDLKGTHSLTNGNFAF